MRKIDSRENLSVNPYYKILKLYTLSCDFTIVHLRTSRLELTYTVMFITT